ncbi:hypothetical protein L486_02510 [Kwoniella mangroviensis CBS 10435]|uniref:Zn(2)-C6 fungal-type domain-containing protein n=1 Tax=Kwoniella mangroviensis CBS 10435 TaxID=1331196 RepID=A0A1B9IWD5_9TREE|nr:hypothetical protein L486_02510 [Kwoniella mangroviensis CBS 10435]
MSYNSTSDPTPLVAVATASYPPLGQPVSGVSTDSTLPNGSTSNPSHYSSNMSYPLAASQPGPNWSSAYITNSQNAWMNWSTAPPPPSTEPIYNASGNTTSYGSAFNYSNSRPNIIEKASEHIYGEPKVKNFDTAFAAPAINLGTGDRFSQLLEAKMSMMNGNSGASTPVINVVEAGGSSGPMTEAQYPSYDYPMQQFPAQPQNPYQPVSDPSSSSLNPSPNGYLTSNRYSTMIIPPPSTNLSDPFNADMGVSSNPLETSQTQNQTMTQPGFMPDSDKYYYPPPPPPQGDIPEPSTVTSPRSTLTNFLSHQPNMNHQYQEVPPYINRLPPLDPLSIEKRLADWSQVHIQPDLVAPLPASVQEYKRRTSPPVVGDGLRYEQPSTSNTSTDYFQQYPPAFPQSSAQTQIYSQGSSARQSFNPSPSVNHLQASLSSSTQTSIPSSTSPSILPDAVDQSQSQPQRTPTVTGWTSSQHLPSTSQSVPPPPTAPQEEALPPLLKIRVKDTASALPPPPENLELEPILEWTSTQPALIPKRPAQPKDVSGSTNHKGKKFSFKTSVSRADLGMGLGSATKGHSHRKVNEKEVSQNKGEISRIVEKHTSKSEEKETKKGSGKRKRKSSIHVEEHEEEDAETKNQSVKVTKPPIEKTFIACNNCRAKKLKCNGEKPKCFHCHRRGEETCVYEAILRRRGPGKHNKEKKPKSKSKKKSARNAEDDSNSDSESGSTSEDANETSVLAKKSKSSSVSLSKSKSSSSIGADMKESVESHFESFGLGGGGSIGRIDTRRLKEDEIQNMSYILKPQTDFSKTDGYDDRELPLTNQGQGNLAMGFGAGLNIIDGGTQHLGGIGTRFVMSTARE